MRRLLSCPLAALALVASARGQTIVLELNPALSAATAEPTLAISADGSFAGDFDPRTNPGGTRTLLGPDEPGANDPVPCVATWTGSFSVATPVEGSFAFTPLAGNTGAMIAGLEFELLGGASIQAPADGDLAHEGFATVAPESAFEPGNLVATTGAGLVLDSMLVAQAAPALASLAPAGPGAWLVSAAVPLTLFVGGSLHGAPFDASVQATVLLSGLYANDGVAASVALSGFGTLAGSSALDGSAYDGVPLALATQSPPGDVANIVLDGALEALVGSGLLALQLEASACAPSTPDLDCDGTVDGADLGLLLGAWGTSGPGDLDGNGVVDGADLGLLLGSWS